MSNVIINKQQYFGGKVVQIKTKASNKINMVDVYNRVKVCILGKYSSIYCKLFLPVSEIVCFYILWPGKFTKNDLIFTFNYFFFIHIVLTK